VSGDRIGARFREAYGVDASVVASAPGRVNLIGEHTDYNGGEVLPIAIARRTWIAVAPASGSETRVQSANQATRGAIDPRQPRRVGAWWDYVAGVLHELQLAGANVPPALVLVESDVPAASGLSSSAALELASALALVTLAGDGPRWSMRDLALLCQRAETQFVGVASGIMDQFASGLTRAGEALHLWCDRIETELVPMRAPVLIFDTAVPRALTNSAFNLRQQECTRALALLRARRPGLDVLAHATADEVRAAVLPDPLGARARHVVEETRRVSAVVDALRTTGTLPGEVLLASHASLRDLYECSSPALDWFVDRVMRLPGIRGARLTGAGWGGCAIAVGDEQALREAGKQLTSDYSVAFGRTPRTWLTNAESGARVESSL
jgi:galactokinase